MDDLPITEPTV